ncbi:MAG: invasion associated locus B family protein [Azospirillaceae bacterium]|nr:invasion associated locus B family protein [Azospirillaceae bacterium]
MNNAIRAVSLAALLIALSDPVLAAEPHFIGTFHDWNAFTFQDGNNTVCYMATRPKKTETKIKKRGDAYALITQRPAEKSFDVVSIIGGYAYKPNADVVVKIGKETFKLFSKDDTAWAPDPATDKAITAALRKSPTMTVKAMSAAGESLDTYSLNGAGAAYNAINTACKIKR